MRHSLLMIRHMTSEEAVASLDRVKAQEISSELIVARYPNAIRLDRSDFGVRHFESVLAVKPCLCDVNASDLNLVGRIKTFPIFF